VFSNLDFKGAAESARRPGLFVGRVLRIAIRKAKSSASSTSIRAFGPRALFLGAVTTITIFGHL